MAAIASLDRKCTLMILHRPPAVWLQGTAAFCLEFFASSFFLLQFFADSTMMDQCGNLPPGQQWSTKTVMKWQWRCPCWEECGNRRMLYKKSTRDEAVNAGACHLFNTNNHPIGYTWKSAQELSGEGIILETKEFMVVIDESGQEMFIPTRLGWENKGKGKGKSDAVDYGGGRRRSRSRDRRLH